MRPNLERVDRSHARTRLAFLVLAGQYVAARSMIKLEPTLQEWADAPHRAWMIPDELADRLMQQATSRLTARYDGLISWSRIPGHALWFMDPAHLAHRLLQAPHMAPACLDAELVLHLVAHSPEYARAFEALPEADVIRIIPLGRAFHTRQTKAFQALLEHPSIQALPNAQRWLQRSPRYGALLRHGSHRLPDWLR